MLDDYRQLLVFVYCCMLIVSHRTQGATDGLHRRPTPTAYTDGLHQRPTPTHPEVATLHRPLPATREGRDYHDCVRLHYHLLADYHKVFSFLYLKLQTTK